MMEGLEYRAGPAIIHLRAIGCDIPVQYSSKDRYQYTQIHRVSDVRAPPLALARSLASPSLGADFHLWRFAVAAELQCIDE